MKIREEDRVEQINMLLMSDGDHNTTFPLFTFTVLHVGHLWKSQANRLEKIPGLSIGRVVVKCEKKDRFYFLSHSHTQIV